MEARSALATAVRSPAVQCRKARHESRDGLQLDSERAARSLCIKFIPSRTDAAAFLTAFIMHTA